VADQQPTTTQAKTREQAAEDTAGLVTDVETSIAAAQKALDLALKGADSDYDINDLGALDKKLTTRRSDQMHKAAEQAADEKRRACGRSVNAMWTTLRKKTRGRTHSRPKTSSIPSSFRRLTASGPADERLPLSQSR
jgi:hypothetical protein